MRTLRGLMVGAGCAIVLAGAVGWGADTATKPSMEAQKAAVLGGRMPRLALGEPAPEILATTIEGKGVLLSGLHGEDAAKPKLIVLQFGSITEPVFRAHMAAAEKLAAKNAQKATWVIVYREESHPADTEAALEVNANDGYAIAAPTNLAERVKLAQQAAERLSIKNQTVLVDAWNNTSSLRYGNYPNMTFIVDGKGVLQAGYPWFDGAKVQTAVDLLWAGKTLTPDLRGSVKLSASAPLDFTGAAVEMTGGRGPATVALALENMTLTEAQRQALFPPLAQFMGDLVVMRQARAGAASPAKAAVPAATTAPAGSRGAKLDDPQEAMAAVQASAAKLKAVIKENLSPKDASALLNALEQTQAQRLFATP